MLTQIQLKEVKTVEIEPESAVQRADCVAEVRVEQPDRGIPGRGSQGKTGTAAREVGSTRYHSK